MIHLILIFLALFVFSRVDAAVLMVKDPVASVWTIPAELPGPFVYPSFCNPKNHDAVSLKTHLSQLVYGERVAVLRPADAHGMLQVAIATQPYFNVKTNTWGPKEGYVHQRHLVSPLSAPLISMVVQAVVTAVRAEPDEQAAVISTLSFGSVVQHCTHETVHNFTKITLADGAIGFIRSADVELVVAQAEAVSVLQNRLCENAKKLVGMPYCWGGRSSFFGTLEPTPKSDYPIPTSVDCSGVISLLMHSLGLVVPGNSTGQHMVAVPIEPAAMQSGDLLLLYFANRRHLANHMLIYLGQGLVFEARGSDGDNSNVRISPIEERFGVPIEKLANGVLVDKKHTLHCGSFFTNQAAVQSMRDAFLANLGKSS